MSTCPIDSRAHKPQADLGPPERQPSETEGQISEGSPKYGSSSPEREGQEVSPTSTRRLGSWNSGGSPRRSNYSPKRNSQQVSPALEVQTERQTAEPLADCIKDTERSLCPFPKNLPPNDIDGITLSHAGAIEKLETAPGNTRLARMGSGATATTMELRIGHGLVIKELFAFCVQAYREVLPTIRRIAKTPDRVKWEEERGRLGLWGDGYAVLEGEFDQLLADAELKYLRESAVIPLCRIAKTLSACLFSLREYISGADSVDSNHRIADPSVELRTLLEVVLGLMPEVKGIIKLDLDDDSGPELNLPDAAEDIKEALNSLFDLVPFIEEHYVTIGEPSGKGHRRARVSTVESTDEAAYLGVQSYKVNIRDKFPDIDEQLAETLAEVNWSRHRRIREWAETHENQEPAEKEGSNFTDFGLGNSNFDFETPLNPSQRNPFSSNVSTTSFGTNNSTMSGGIRIPKMPTPSFSGTIKCCICFRTLSGIDTKLLWKKHVLRDLRPYSCLFNSCSEKKTTFETRRGWVNHEFQHHRPQSEWRCNGSCVEVCRLREDYEHHILEKHLGGAVTASYVDTIVDRREVKRKETECPFCTKVIAENQCSIQNHIGTHMEEIALKVLPIEDESEDETSTENIREAAETLTPLNSTLGGHITSLAHPLLSSLYTDSHTSHKGPHEPSAEDQFEPESDLNTCFEGFIYTNHEEPSYRYPFMESQGGEKRGGENWVFEPAAGASARGGLADHGGWSPTEVLNTEDPRTQHEKDITSDTPRMSPRTKLKRATAIACRFPGCPRKFKHMNDLNWHCRAIHDHRLQLFDCPFPGCRKVGDRGFKRIDDLTQHRRAVHGEKIAKAAIRFGRMAGRSDGNQSGPVKLDPNNGEKEANVDDRLP